MFLDIDLLTEGEQSLKLLLHVLHVLLNIFILQQIVVFHKYPVCIFHMLILLLDFSVIFTQLLVLLFEKQVFMLQLQILLL